MKWTTRWETWDGAPDDRPADRPEIERTRAGDRTILRERGTANYVSIGPVGEE